MGLFCAIKPIYVRYKAMKNTLLISSLFFVITLSAQIPKHEIGFEGGPNFLYGWQKSKSTTSDWVDKYAYKGSLFSLGFLYQRNFTKHNAFRTGLTFEYLGVKEGVGDTAHTHGSPCFSLPLLYQYTLPIKKFAVYGNTGFTFMYTGALDWIFNTGIGFKYRVSPKIAIGIEGRNNLWLHSFAGTESASVWKATTQESGTFTHTYFRNHTSVLLCVAF
jgi:hypothetical protein